MGKGVEDNGNAYLKFGDGSRTTMRKGFIEDRVGVSALYFLRFSNVPTSPSTHWASSLGSLQRRLGVPKLAPCAMFCLQF